MYQHHLTSDNERQFITDNGITYVVEFYSSDYFYPPNCNLCDRTDSINFYPVRPEKKHFDTNICETIADIIRLRCQETQGAILFFCDSADSRAKCRLQLFGRWYDRYGKEDYHYQTSIIEYGDYITYVGLIVPIENPEALEFLKEFALGIELFNTKKL